MTGPPLRSVVLVAVLLLVASAPAKAWPPSPYGTAAAIYRDGRYPDAFGRFRTLALAGDADAARIVLFMHQYGPALYGSYWDLTEDEIDHFNRTAAAGQLRPQPPYPAPWQLAKNKMPRPNAAPRAKPAAGNRQGHR